MRKQFKQIVASLVLSSFVFGQAAYADCKDPVTHLNQGQPADCEGYLFRPDKEYEMRMINEEFKLQQQQIDHLNSQVDFYKKEVDNLQAVQQLEANKAELWRKTAEDASEKLIKQDERQGYRDFFFLGLGVALTIGAGYALGQAAKK